MLPNQLLTFALCATIAVRSAELSPDQQLAAAVASKNLDNAVSALQANAVPDQAGFNYLLSKLTTEQSSNVGPRLLAGGAILYLSYSIYSSCTSGDWFNLYSLATCSRNGISALVPAALLYTDLSKPVVRLTPKGVIMLSALNARTSHEFVDVGNNTGAAALQASFNVLNAPCTPGEFNTHLANFEKLTQNALLPRTHKTMVT